MATTQAAAPAAAVSDVELVRRARARDEFAVRAITEQHNRRLFRIARGILRSDAEAEDVVQETYVRALTGLDEFRADASLGTWLTRIAINDALGRLRQRRPTVTWDDDSEAVLSAHVLPFPTRTSSGGDPETTVATNEMRLLIERSIDSLPDAFRTVFIARMVEGLSVEETAELLNLRPETVKTRVHRARRRLRADLERHIGSSVGRAFPFDGARCQRLTEAVVALVVGNLPAPAASNPSREP
jgi:RNA polymerase sigma-70 factor (ECF subfamily)